MAEFIYFLNKNNTLFYLIFKTFFSGQKLLTKLIFKKNMQKLT